MVVLTDIEQTILRQLDYPATKWELAMECDHCAPTLVGALLKVGTALSNLRRLGYVEAFVQDDTWHYRRAT